MSTRILRNIWRLTSRRLYLPRSIIRIVPNSSIFQFQSSAAVQLISNCSVNFSTKPAVDAKLKSFEEFFNILKSQQNFSGSVNYNTLEKTIDTLDDTISEDHSLFLIKCCGYYLPAQSCEERLELFNRLWNCLKNNNVISERHYLSALNIFQANKTPLAGRESFIEECKAKGSVQIYEELIWLFCSSGNIKEPTIILEEMKIKKFPLTENVFNALILGHSRSKDLQGINTVLEAMTAAGINPTSETYSELARAYIENGVVEKCEKILSEHGGSFNTSQVLKVLKSATFYGLSPTVNQAVKLLPVELLNIKEIPQAVRNICTELIFLGLPKNAFLIIEAFPKPNFSENQDRDTFGVSFIIDLIKSEQPASVVIEFCKNLVSSEKNTRALHRACELALRWNSREALTYLEALGQLEALRPHYFWPLLLRNFKSNGEAGIFSTLKAMHALKTECDYETLSTYVMPNLSITLEDEKRAIKTFENCGLKTSEILPPLILQLIFQQKVDQIISICERYPTKIDVTHLIHPLINLISTRANRKFWKLAKLISALDTKCNNLKFDFVGQLLTEIVSRPKLRNDTNLLKNLIVELNKQQLKISPLASDTVCNHLSIFKENNDILSLQKTVKEMININLNISDAESSGSYIRHPRYMSLDELELHLVELESKELNTRGVLRRLLQVCVREGKLDRAVEIKKKCDELNVQISPGMMASIFDMYVKLKRLEDAEVCYARINNTFPGFLLDEHKIIDFATLLMENNRFEDVKDILSKRAETTKINGGEYIIKNLWRLLTKCASVAAAHSSKDDINKTKELFQLLQNLRYCRPQNVLLGPILREYLARNNIKTAVAEYKEFVEKYRSTPLQFEIMSQLVSLSNAENTDKFQISSDEAKDLLQEVIAATVTIHGSTNTNNTLVLAVANSGTESQLRKLLINPEIRLNTDSLIKDCEHISNSGKIEMLLRLAKAGKGMGHAVKEQDLYNILLHSFVKENNCPAALELFEKLQADDEFKISQNFLKTLVNLLKINNLEIPPSVALRAHNLL